MILREKGSSRNILKDPAAMKLLGILFSLYKSFTSFSEKIREAPAVDLRKVCALEKMDAAAQQRRVDDYRLYLKIYSPYIAHNSS